MERIFDRRKLWLAIKKQGLSVFYTKTGFLARTKDGMGYIMAINHGVHGVAVTKCNCALI
jgi:hypothetical protein